MNPTQEQVTSDVLLIAWIVISAGWDVAVWGMWAYLVFWRGRSGWWALIAIMLTYSPTLYKVLRKRYGVPEEEESD